ncbi:murein biosynthesis integral membrane protein MurJ [Streptomyces sp. NPDC004726]
MVLGSLVSRLSGFLRGAVVVAALGTGLVGDAFTVANTVPNIVYILLIGGALNSVFVPELVRAAKEHADGGVAYTDRLLTVCAVALLTITAAAVLAAPWIVTAYTDYTGAQRELVLALTRFCLPQILFYGVFTVLGQVLNSRDRFGAMMWTPVLNNIVVIAVFGLYLAVAADASNASDLSDAHVLLLGLGSTAGIAVQALALLPSLRAAGFRWRPRFDWRGAGIARPMRAAGWTLALVLVNQIAYWAVTRLSTSAGTEANAEGITAGVGYTAYTNAYQLWVVPQGVITVSLVTALLPAMSRAAVSGDMGSIAADLSRGVRVSAVAIVPAAVVFLVFAPQVVGVAYQYAQVDEADARAIALVLAAFAPGLPAFAAQYALARGFYALSDTRTPFLMTLVIAGLNTAGTVAAYRYLPAHQAVAGMAGGYAVACGAGVACTAWVLHRRLRALDPRRRARGLRGRRVLVTHFALVVACLPGALIGYAAAVWSTRMLGPGPLGDLAGLILGVTAVAVSVLILSGPLRITEVTGFTRRFSRGFGRRFAANGRHRQTTGG